MVSNRGPSAYQPNALPLGQTSSQAWGWVILIVIMLYDVIAELTILFQAWGGLCIHRVIRCYSRVDQFWFQAWGWVIVMLYDVIAEFTILFQASGRPYSSSYTTL